MPSRRVPYVKIGEAPAVPRFIAAKYGGDHRYLVMASEIITADAVVLAEMSGDNPVRVFIGKSGGSIADKIIFNGNFSE